LYNRNDYMNIELMIKLQEDYFAERNYKELLNWKETGEEKLNVLVYRWGGDNKVCIDDFVVKKKN
jgi:hypothetical protein